MQNPLYIVILFASMVVSSQAQTTTLTLPVLAEEPGAQVTFPLTVTDFNDVNAISLVIDYSPATLTFVRAGDEAEGVTFIDNVEDGALRLAWAGITPVSLADGDTLVALVFDYAGGTSELMFDPDQNELNDPQGDQIAVVYENGRISTLQETAILTLPHLTSSPGENIAFSLVVDNFDNINAISLVLHHSEAVLSFTGVNNQAQGVQFISNASSGELRLAWAGISPVFLADGDTLVDLLFDYAGGNSELTFDETESELNNPDGNPLPVEYLNGQISLRLEPDIAVAPTIYDFGEVIENATASHNFVATNDGNADLQVDAPALTGEDASQFAITAGGTAFVVSPGASHDIVVEFRPTTVGEKQAGLRLSSNDPDENPIDVPLAGTGLPIPVPDIAVIPETHDFGETILNETAEHIFTVHNQGSADLLVTALAVTGEDAQHFAISANPAPFVLAPDDSVEITAAFTPTSLGQAHAALRFENNDPDEDPFDVSLSGTGIPVPAPDIAITPTEFNFGEVTRGNTTSRLFVISNEGTANLNVQAPTLTGMDVSEFNIESGVENVTLAPAEAHEVVVAFMPVTLGEKTVVLRIESNDLDENPTDVPLAGTSVPIPVPDIAAIPEMHDFGATILNETAEHTFIVHNEGTADLEVAGLTVTGQDAQQFAILADPAPFVLAPDESLDVTATFTPTSLGEKSAALRFDSNDSDENPFEVGLTGTGTPEPVPDISVTPLQHDYGEVALDSTVSKTFVTQNTGTSNLSVIATTLAGEDAEEFTVLDGNAPFVVAPGDSQDIVASFTPVSAGSKSATLSLANNDPDNATVEIQLTGMGKEEPTGVRDLVAGVSDFVLRPNYPNPFNPETLISYALPRPAHVRLTIFNLLGQQVSILLNQEKTAGEHRAIWVGRDESGNPAPSGVYLYRLEADGFVATKKLILLR